MEMVMLPVYFWLFLGLFFVIAEFLLPSFFIIFFGLGAWVTAIFVWLVPTTPVWLALLVFILSSIGLLLGLRAKLAPIFKGEEERDKENNENIGATAEVVETITPQKRGIIKMRGTTWSATAEQEIVAGEQVIVVATVPNEPMSYVVRAQ